MADRKQTYFAKLINLLDSYQKILIVHCDNVGSNHMQSIRRNLRGKAEILMGKNTMMRKAIKGHLTKNPQLEALLVQLKGNVGLVFTNEDAKAIHDEIIQNKKMAPARVGAIAPCDVFIPAGVTTLDPSFTSFVQAMNIASRISKGCIEIISDIHLIKKGAKVGNSEASLLEKLSITPFFYGLIPLNIYDSGECYPPKVLEYTQEMFFEKITFAFQRVSALSLCINFPTIGAVPHIVGKAYQNLCAISIASDYTFDRIKDLKELLDNPEALAAATAAAAATAQVTVTAEAPAAKVAAKEVVEEKKEEAPAEEEEEGGFGDLFG